MLTFKHDSNRKDLVHEDALQAKKRLIFSNYELLSAESKSLFALQDFHLFYDFISNKKCDTY
jgi:hypothetical protein